MQETSQWRHYQTECGRIAYELLEPTEAGAGAPTLTLVHNFMSTGRAAWGPLLAALNRHFRILLPDIPGHGRSVGHPPAFHHWAIARQLAALMRAVGAAEHAHLAGCSSGGMLAQMMVHHRMVRPQTLALVSTTYSTDPQRTGTTRPLTPDEFQASPTWMEATARLHDPFQGSRYFERELLPGFRALTPGTSIDLSLENLSSFAMPVCLIHGERDEFFPVQVAEDMAHAFPNAELHIIPRQSHALIFRQPWKVATLLTHFLENHSR